MPLNNLITIRKGTYSEWISSSAVLASGEPGFDTTNRILKIGDGTSTWENLLNQGLFSNLDLTSQVSGDTLLSIEGTNGNLFSVVDSVSGSLLSVNDITGLPAFEVFSDHSIVAGRFNQNDFIISSSGNVGIGKEPDNAYKLDVKGKLNLANNLGDNVTFLVDENLGDLVVDVGGSERVRVDTNGQVGIGTDTPDGKLHVLGDTYQQGSLYISNSSPLGALTYNRIYSGGSDNFIIQGGSTSLTLSGQGGSATLNASSTNVTIGNSYDASSTNQYIRFTPANNEAMRIDAAGRVGIGGFGAGQSSYAYKLEVKNGAPFFYPNETGEDAAALHLGRYSTGYGAFFSIKTHDESSYRTNFLINRFIGRYRFSITDGTLGTEHQAEIYPTTGGNALDLYNFNNEVKTKISAGTADSYFNGGGNVGIGTTSPSSMLDIRTSGNPVLIARTSNGQNIFQYLKFDDTNLLRARFDGSNFHHYLDARLYYNIGAYGVTFDGGGGTNQSQVSVANRAYIALNSNTTSAPGNANIYAGPSAYATVDNQLTSISPIAIKTWAWNGSDGYTLGAVGYIKQTQNSATNGDARLSIVEGDTNSEIFVVDYAKKNIGIGTTSPQAKIHAVSVANGDELLRLQATPTIGGGTRSLRVVGNASSIDFGVYDNAGNKGTWSYLRLNREGGYVGINTGTSYPTTALDVNGVITATGGNSTEWNTAYDWGNHASAGYQSASTALTTSTSFGGGVSGTYDNIVIADDSHNHIISNVDGLQTALDNKLSTTLKGANNGLAELDSGGKVPSSQLPSYVDDVLEYDTTANFPTTGETGKIYVATGTNLTYRWSGSSYVEISASLALGNTSSTAYRGDRGEIAYDHSQATTGSIHGSTTVGGNLLRLTDPSAITFLRVNANNTISALDAAAFRTAIGAGTSSTTGTVTSVGGTGTVAGLTLTGTVTTTGNLTLGGTLSVSASNFSSQTANTFLAAPNGSAGTPTFRAIVAADIPTLNQDTTGSANTLLRSGGLTTQYGAGLLGFASQIGSTTAGIFPVSNNANAILTLNRHPGDYYSQLGFSSNGKLYYRAFNNVAIDTTKAWQTIWTSTSLTNLNQLTNGPGYTTNTGTVTSVAALTLGTTGTDVSSTVANGTTTPVITLNIPTASASNRGALSSTDWTTFNNKQAAITGGATTITSSNLTASRALVSDVNGKVAVSTITTTELSYLDNVSSNIQTQLDERISSTTSDDFSGVLAFNNPGGTAFHIRGGGSSRTEILRVSAAEINENISSNTGSDYGFNIVYRGDLSGVENALSIEADNQTGTAVESLRIKQDGVVYFNSTPYVGAGVVWHEGNDGSGSTLDADLLDGQHASAFQPLLTNPVTGTGTTNYVSKWTSSSGQGNSIIFDNGANVGIGTTSPSYKLDVADVARVGGQPVNDVCFIVSDDGSNSNFTVKGGGHIYSAGNLDVRGSAVFNEGGGNNDFRVEGDTDANLFFVDASTDKIGIGTTTPGEKLEVNGNIKMVAGSYIDWGNSFTKISDDASNGRTSIRTRGSKLDILNNAGNAWGTLRADTITAGTSVSAGLKIKSTSGAGTSDYISLAVGNDGGTEAIRIINSGYVGINTSTPTYNLQVNGSFGATTKSFRIDHPSKPNYTLEYGSLESPYHGVRLTGRGKVVKGVGVVDLPSYLKDLIHDDENINIQLTNLKHGKTLYVSDIDLNNSQFTVKADRAKTVGDLEFFWTFTGVRKDVPSLVVEQEK